MPDEPRTSVRRRREAHAAGDPVHPLPRMSRQARMATVLPMPRRGESDAGSVRAMGSSPPGQTPLLDVILPVIREDIRRENARVVRAIVEMLRANGERHLAIVR